MVKRAAIPPERQAQLQADFARNNTRDMRRGLQAYLRWLRRDDDPARRLCEAAMPAWVVHAEKGDLPEGNVKVLYPNSLDVRWHAAPKPKAAQNGLWMLHATDGDLAKLAPFQLLHAQDFQAPQVLESLRKREG